MPWWHVGLIIGIIITVAGGLFMGALAIIDLDKGRERNLGQERMEWKRERQLPPTFRWLRACTNK